MEVLGLQGTSWTEEPGTPCPITVVTQCSPQPWRGPTPCPSQRPHSRLQISTEPRLKSSSESVAKGASRTGGFL